MNLTAYSLPTLQSKLWAEDSFIKQTLFFLGGIFTLVFATQLSIPLDPIPLTFQSATVILLGMTFGSRRGAAIIACYWMMGLAGMPVFANFHAGFPVFFGSTGGYLLGFLPAAWVSGYLAEHGFAKNVFLSFIASMLGASIIFFFGILFLSSFIGLKPAIAAGLMPFIISEPIKLLVVSLLIPRLWKKS